MHFTYRLTGRIVLFLFVLLALVVAHSERSKAVGGVVQASALGNSQTPKHLASARKRLSLSMLHRVPTLPSTPPRRAPNQPCNPCGSGDLKYHNGAVQLDPKAYLIFWGSAWQDNSGNLVKPGQIVTNYFSDVGGTNFENILTQYYMQNSDGSQTYSPNTLQFDNTHVWIDTSSITSTDNNCIITTIEDTTIQGEISKAIQTKSWPSDDYNATYFVYTPAGYTIRHNNECSSSLFNGDCGYHFWTSTFVYAAIPYPNPLCPVPNSPNGNADGDSLANTSSHEQFEAITDPTLGAMVGGKVFDGWYDSTGYEGEISDKCDWNFMAGTTQLKNGGIFELQEEYSDASNSCVIAFPPHLQITPNAVDLTTKQDINPSPQQLTIKNTGGTLNWKLTSTLPSWLTVNPTSGSLTYNGSQTVTLTFNMPTNPQTYTTTLVFSDPQADNSPVSIPVQVVVTPRTWSVVSSPNVSGGKRSELYRIAVVSATDIWAVGDDVDSSGLFQKTLIEHWDGTKWSIISSPNVGMGMNQLDGVTAIAATDIWAVGCYFNTSTSSDQALIEHWDGSSWSIVSSSTAGTTYSALTGLVAVSANDIWAVGNYGDPNGIGKTLVEHWDGVKWSIVSSPNITGASANTLNGITAVSATDIWAVGSFYQNVLLTLVEHWDGVKWSIVSSPNIAAADDVLGQVAAASSSSIWAVGFFDDHTHPQALIEHWDGAGWSIVSSPNVGTGINQLGGVAAISIADVWAVGVSEPNSTAAYQTLIEHWDGTKWSVVSSPNVGMDGNILSGIAAISANNVWAVGDYLNDSTGNYQTLIESYS